MEEYTLLAASVGSLIMGLMMVLDKSPILHRSIKVKYRVKNKRIFKFFPFKESFDIPYNYFRVMPFLITSLTVIAAVILYLITYIFDVDIVIQFFKSSNANYVGVVILGVSYIYPIFLLIFNKFHELRYNILDEDEREKIDLEFQKIQKHIQNISK